MHDEGTSRNGDLSIDLEKGELHGSQQLFSSTDVSYEKPEVISIVVSDEGNHDLGGLGSGQMDKKESEVVSSGDEKSHVAPNVVLVDKGNKDVSSGEVDTCVSANVSSSEGKSVAMSTLVVPEGGTHDSIISAGLVVGGEDSSSGNGELSVILSPKKAHLSRNSSDREQCRVCQQEKDEALINLGCQCRGELAKTHRSCIDTWFRTKGSNICEICQQVAVNVPPPESHPTARYWVFRVDPAFRGPNIAPERQRGCYSPLWVAFSILIGGILLDVLISITLGVSALPVNIIIGVIVVLGLGTALRLALEFFQDWNIRRVTHQMEPNVNFGYNAHL